ncbi:uncharacterized protein N7518_003573 [Penicillium psychrosexuale]|uniref:uncharacterized protein n=1 Tax=Penicillium psychrosexuale TaxID=1002107 RepID=UPI0025450492|nr:uncharacterized protein N7518_003573 [Penicillium psychrosexuale]KAJ5801505.1 hypothetical protein N7518_003573 [Penicillium psychrosexuale]
MEYLGSVRAQADDLPPFEEITITNVKKLSERSDLKSWKTNPNLLDIISKHQHIPRPILDHIKYENWLKWSQLTYLAIINLLPDAEDIEVREFMKLWTMRRCQFCSLHAFVSTCRAQASICKEVKIGVSCWWLPTQLILHELKGEMPDLAYYINFGIGEQPPNEPERMTYREFDRIVGGILHTLNRDNQSSL